MKFINPMFYDRTKSMLVATDRVIFDATLLRNFGLKYRIF